VSQEKIVSQELGSEQRPLRVAIIGAGPSGFYAAGSLLQQDRVHVLVDMYDRLPTPFGLVRYGVAPDHQKIKSVTKVYDRTASDPRFRFFGNIDFGTDLTHADLRQYYDQIIYAVGAQSDRKLNIPGEELHGSLSATEFVAWYNGHPDFVDLDVNLDCTSAIVIGVGNVAMDVARILAKTVDELRTTDIADHALEELAKSKITDIYILSRRGPAQVKFTPAEIKEFGELAAAEPVVDADDLQLDPLSDQEIADDPAVQKDIAILKEFAEQPPLGKPRRVHFHFLSSPVELIGDAGGRVQSIRIERNELRPNSEGYLNAHGTGQYYTLPACLVLRSVGYKGIALEDVPYDTRTGTIPNVEGRVIDPATGQPLTGEYVVGWAKRGPSGIIGTNKPDAAETAERALSDVPSLTPAPEDDPAAIEGLLEERKLNFVTIEGWRILDQLELTNGIALGKPRVKFTRIQDMLNALHAAVKVKMPG
jgi:ferredoxin--NADP+ reductase